MEAPLRRVIILALAFGLVTISDGFLYLLVVQRSQADAFWIPLFYTGTAVSFLILAIPFGYLADRIGRRTVFIGGHAPLLAAYGVTLGGFLPWPWNAVAAVLLLGAYYAASDGVIAGLAGGLLPVDGRSTGFAWVATAVSVGRLCSSVMFGFLWTLYGDGLALLIFTVALAGVMIAFGWFGRDGEAPALPLGSGRARHDVSLTARRMFLLVCLAAVAAVFAYVALVPSRSNPPSDVTPPAGLAEFITAVPDGPIILFRDGSPGPLFGRLAIARLPLTDQRSTDCAVVVRAGALRSGMGRLHDHRREPPAGAASRRRVRRLVRTAALVSADRSADPRARRSGRKTRGPDGIRDRTLLRRCGVLDPDGADRDGERTPDCGSRSVRGGEGRPGLQVGRLQFLGADVRA